MKKIEHGVELEYGAIREEIVSLTSSKDQLTAEMYTICITIIGLSTFLDVEEIIGLIFIVLIPFQAFINTKLFQIARCGAYINVFIEPKIKGMKWEQIIHKADERFNCKYRINFGKMQFTRNIGKYGSSIFSVLVVIVYFFHNVTFSNSMLGFNEDAICIMGLYIVLGIFVFYLNKKGANFEKIYDTYINILKEYNK